MLRAVCVTPPDPLLILQTAHGDREAFTELLRRHRAVMFALSCRIAGDRMLAEDATQDACLEAWSRAATYSPDRGSVRGWLLTVVRSRTLDRLRARQVRDGRVHRGVDPDTVAAPDVDLAFNLDRDSRLAIVEAAIEVLPHSDRRILELAYVNGFTHTEIAEELDIPLGTAKTQLRRNIQTLRAVADERTHRPFEWHSAPGPMCGAVRSLAELVVLVVDDEPNTVRLTELVLKHAGAIVMPAASATQALARIASRWPDLALIDLEMPGMDGFTLMRRLGGLRAATGRVLRAVAFTAHGASLDREHTRQAGFDLHLPKPIRPAALVGELARIHAAHA